jgi:hypothetical protein
MDGEKEKFMKRKRNTEQNKEGIRNKDKKARLGWKSLVYNALSVELNTSVSLYFHFFQCLKIEKKVNIC